MKALSIQQPWAWAIATGKKDVENRTWPTKRRGWVLIHAGKKVDLEAMRELTRRGVLRGTEDMQTGAIVGAMRIDDCVTTSKSEWFSGPHGFTIGDAVEFKRPLAMPGMLGFFEVPPGWPELEEQLPAEAREATPR